MKKSIKVLITVVVLIILIGGGFFAWQYFGVPEEEVKGETADWQTYRNEEHGFEVKYPKDWEIFLAESSIVSVVDFVPQGFKAQTGLLFGPFRISARHEDLSQHLESFNSRDIKEVFVNNIPVKEVKGFYYRATFHSIYIENPHVDGFMEIVDDSYNYEEAGKITNQEAENLRKVFNQMLSTFRFIEGKTAGPTISCEYKKGEYEFRVYDSEGYVTGLVNGAVKQEISRSTYIGGDVTIYFPQDYYEYELFALKEGNYQLTKSSVQEGEEITFRAINIPISRGATHRYKINWKTLTQAKEGATLLIDDDGDGIFEKTVVISGIDFTCEEFIAQTKK
ncbi:MAG: hypothetical protein Q8P63_01150 [Candidatus Nealsonbacteria bacterium]|nr:hypothetical protein [Candidatus Nealsonbacteria bacterium]